MADYRTRKQLMLLGLEASEGVEESLAVGADEIEVEDIQYSPNFGVEDTNEHTSYLDPASPVAVGGNVGMSFKALLKGSGTQGTAPQWGRAARGAGLAESTLGTAATGTAQAGAASTITLAAGASAVDDAYKGMPIKLTGGTGSGQRNVITAYNGTTKVATVGVPWASLLKGTGVAPDATSVYSVDKNVLYVPASTDLETATIYNYQIATPSAVNALLRKMIGAASNLSLDLPVRGIGRLQFNYTGILPALPDNVAPPSAPTFDSTRPPPFIAARSYVGGVECKFNRFTLDMGNQVGQADDVTATYGYDVAGVNDRRINGTINPILSLLSTRNVFSDFLAGNEKVGWWDWGSTDGNRISLLVPAMRYTGATPADINGYAGESVPFRAVGLDSAFYLCVY